MYLPNYLIAIERYIGYESRMYYQKPIQGKVELVIYVSVYNYLIIDPPQAS